MSNCLKKKKKKKKKKRGGGWYSRFFKQLRPILNAECLKRAGTKD